MRIQPIAFFFALAPNLALAYSDPHIHDADRWMAKHDACERKYGENNCSYIDAKKIFVPYCEVAKVKGCARISSKPHLKNGLPYY